MDNNDQIGAVPYAYRHRTGDAIGQVKSPLSGRPIFNITSRVDWGVDDSTMVIDYGNPSSAVINLDSQANMKLFSSTGGFGSGKKIYTHTVMANGTYGDGSLVGMALSGSLYFKVQGLNLYFNITSPY